MASKNVSFLIPVQTEIGPSHKSDVFAFYKMEHSESDWLRAERPNVILFSFVSFFPSLLLCVFLSSRLVLVAILLNEQRVLLPPEVKWPECESVSTTF